MSDAGPGTVLTESLASLQAALHMIRAELSHPVFSVEGRLRKLSAIVNELDQPKRVRPVPVATEYVNQWNEVVAGRRSNLDSRATRSLCWNPVIATDKAFQSFLVRTQYV